MNQSCDLCPYIRPLAIKNESIDILNAVGKAVKNSTNVELITRISDVSKLKNKTAIKTFEITRFMTALYSQISFKNYNLQLYNEASDSFIYLFS